MAFIYVNSFRSFEASCALCSVRSDASPVRSEHCSVRKAKSLDVFEAICAICPSRKCNSRSPKAAVEHILRVASDPELFALYATAPVLRRPRFLLGGHRESKDWNIIDSLRETLKWGVPS